MINYIGASIKKRYLSGGLFCLLFTIFIGYAFYSMEMRETIAYGPQELDVKCVDYSNWSHLFFSGTDKIYRSNKFRIPCSKAERRLLNDWEIGVKKGTSFVVYIKSSAGYIEGDSSGSMIKLWHYLIMTVLTVISANYILKGFRK